jgi:hypothetical protein
MNFISAMLFAKSVQFPHRQDRWRKSLRIWNLYSNDRARRMIILDGLLDPALVIEV